MVFLLRETVTSTDYTQSFQTHVYQGARGKKVNSSLPDNWHYLKEHTLIYLLLLCLFLRQGLVQSRLTLNSLCSQGKPCSSYPPASPVQVLGMRQFVHLPELHIYSLTQNSHIIESHKEKSELVSQLFRILKCEVDTILQSMHGTVWICRFLILIIRNKEFLISSPFPVSLQDHVSGKGGEFDTIRMN